jgi:hypothetical protein
MFCWLMAGCTKPHADTHNADNDMAGAYADSIASLQFPMLIEGGTKVVYKFGKMTPRGLKFFLDTTDYHGGTPLPDSIKKSFIFPLSLSNLERDTIPCVIAWSRPGEWHETIIGVIDNNSSLRMNYKNRELYTLPVSDFAFKPGAWSAVFRNDSIEVDISAVLEDTKVGDHLGGKGKIRLMERNKLIEDEDIFVVYNKKQMIKPQKNPI